MKFKILPLNIIIKKIIGNNLLLLWPLKQILAWRRSRIRTRRTVSIRKARENAVSLHGVVNKEELLKYLQTLGIESGDTVFCQLSLNDMYTFNGGGVSVLSMLYELVGSNGTLAMPAYTNLDDGERSVFNSDQAPTYTGLVNEIFRRSDGVLRSIHPRHSICARGPKAFFLTSGHEFCARADGVNSPFDKLRNLPNAWILTLGLPPGFISFLHWVEDIEPEQFPLQIYKKDPVEISVVLPDGGSLVVADWVRRDQIAARLDYSRVACKLSKIAMRFETYKGISVGVYKVDKLASELIALRDNGYIHYY